MRFRKGSYACMEFVFINVHVLKRKTNVWKNILLQLFYFLKQNYEYLKKKGSMGSFMIVLSRTYCHSQYPLLRCCVDHMHLSVSRCSNPVRLQKPSLSAPACWSTLQPPDSPHLKPARMLFLTSCVNQTHDCPTAENCLNSSISAPQVQRCSDMFIDDTGLLLSSS